MPTGTIPAPDTSGTPATPGATIVPFLEHVQKGRPARRITIQQLPFRIGRSPKANHVIPLAEVSGQHAEIVRDGDDYVLRDLGSTNGTFVNADRITECRLREGDWVHFATEEHRFGLLEVKAPDADSLARDEETLWRGADASRGIRETHDLGRVLGLQAVSAVFQPIVRLDDQARLAYETLGRITIEEGRYSISETLRIADERGEAARLSRLIRTFAIADLVHLPERPVSVFFNLHPSEMADVDMLVKELGRISAGLGEGQSAVLEIHEGAVTDPKAMRTIRERLSELSIKMAYDDFGAGQSRLMELVEVPPDYLKLDMSLVRDIDRSARRQDLVRAVVSVISGLGIEVLAEGVERTEEADVCRQLGCTLGQGYLFGRPAKVNPLVPNS